MINIQSFWNSSILPFCKEKRIAALLHLDVGLLPYFFVLDNSNSQAVLRGSETIL